jgi:hypothetical protein
LSTWLGKGDFMPTVLREGGYRFFFYSGDGVEPPHIHVEREGRTAKYWLKPVRLASSGGFRRVDLRQIEAIVVRQCALLLEAWDEFFGG